MRFLLLAITTAFLSFASYASAQVTHCNRTPIHDGWGNGLYPNKKRIHDNWGNSLYSNGQRVVDNFGNLLYPNGKPVYNSWGLPFYPHGKPMRNSTGRFLHPNGQLGAVAGDYFVGVYLEKNLVMQIYISRTTGKVEKMDIQSFEGDVLIIYEMIAGKIGFVTAGCPVN